ncbi:MAG: hypothetical protein KF894_29580 [Labilithrix sp.]|nr:hypothetical protein [Labilithrix sp.]
MSGPVFSVASVSTKKPERYFWAIWRSAADLPEPGPLLTGLDYVDPFASGRSVSRAKAVATALEVSPAAEELRPREASYHAFRARRRDRAMLLGRRIAHEIARYPQLLRLARHGSANVLMAHFNILTGSCHGYESGELAFAYAIRWLHGEASEGVLELEKFAFVDDLVAQALREHARR